MLKFKSRYFYITGIIFLIEILIAVFLKKGIIRYYIGDFLVVILIYSFLRSFFNLRVSTTAFMVLAFSYTVEILQYYNLVEMIGLQDYRLARIIIGTSFAWIDLIAYTLGILFVWVVEKIIIIRITPKEARS
ncbi:MAG: DUF2809 domain-containing protein [Ferruginibacter sp.]|nr:DUF2809 domain-containing protein [Ferruginibacter sp.]